MGHDWCPTGIINCILEEASFEQASEQVTDRGASVLAYASIIALLGGAKYRYKGRLDVKEAYKEGDYEELQKLEKEATRYQEEYFEHTISVGWKKATFMRNLPVPKPNRALTYWYQVGMAEAFSEIYRENDVSADHSTNNSILENSSTPT